MNNYYAASAPLQRMKKGSPGGWCKMYYVPVEDIDNMPGVSQNGIIDLDITLKPGRSWRMLPVPDGERGYKEEVKDADGGKYTETTITASMPFNNTRNATQLVRMKYEQYICVMVNRDKTMRVIGSKEAPAKVTYVYNNGQRGTAAGTTITFSQVCEDGPLVYTGEL